MRGERLALAGVALAAVAAAAIAAAGGLLLTGAGDGLLFNYPMRVIAGRMLAAGVPPLWNPYVFGGVPLLAGVQAAVLHPTTWLFAVLPGPLAMNLLVTTSYAVALAGAYACARRVGCSRAGAVVGALAFGAGGFMVAHLGHPNMVAAAACVPVVFALLETLRRAPRGRVVAALALVLTLQCFAGHAQIWLYTLGAVVPFAALTTLDLPSRASRLRYLAAVVAALALAGGLAAVQLIPAAELALQGARRFEPATMGYYSLPTPQAATLLFPFLFGDTTPGTPYPYWGGGNIAELSAYVGLVPVMLVAAVLPALARRRARPFALLAVLALLVALKDVAPTKWLLGVLPGFSAFPVAARALLFVDFALALLAGLSLTWLARLPRRTAVRLGLLGCGLVATAMAAVVLALSVAPAALRRLSSGPVPDWTFDVMRPGVLVAVGFAVASSAAIGIWLWHPRSRWRAALLAGVLAMDGGCFALVHGAGEWPVAAPREAAWERTLLGLTGDPSTWRFLHPHGSAVPIGALPAVHGLRSLVGYEAFLPPAYARFMGDLGLDGRVGEPGLFGSDRAIDLLGGRYLLIFHGAADRARWRLAPDRWRPVATTPEATIYENLRVMPRAWLVFEARQIARAAALAAVRHGRLPDGRPFDPARLALVERAPAVALPAVIPAEPGEARLASERFGAIEIVTRAPRAALLVLGDVDVPGWSCRVDGERVGTIRADGMLRAVPVAAGERRVACAFAPVSVGIGALLSLLAAGVLVATLRWAPGARAVTAGQPATVQTR